MHGKACAHNSVTKCLSRHARSISTTLQQYIYQHDRGAYRSCDIDSMVDHNPTRQLQKELPVIILLTRHVITQNSGEFLFFKNLLRDAICRHPYLLLGSFLHHLDCDKELCTSFSLLTKSCRLPVVQSTTTGITTCALWHCLHTVIYIHWLQFPLGKLLEYSHCQSHGVMHTVTLWEVTHSIIRTISFCISVGTLHMIPIWLAHVFRVMCSTCAVPGTVFTVYHDSVHFFVVLQDQVVTNAVPARMTLVPCSYSHCTSLL